MSEPLNEVLERFKTKLSYREQDRRALDISRAAAAGSLGEQDYSEWALISNDPLVVINYVKTYITTIASKLSSSPFRPVDDGLNDLCISMRINAQFTELFKSVLADGYAFMGIGVKGGKPVATLVDARYILHNGNDPTLKDATELVVFEVLPRSSDDDFVSSFPTGYVEFDNSVEKVRTSYYHKRDGVVCLDIYDEGVPEPLHYELPKLDRIPVVRFYGERFELEDKRFHYRGLYYQLAGVIKALALAATKVQIRVAASDDDNYVVSADAISNQKSTWRNAGVKVIDTIDANGDQITAPFNAIQHDNQFLVQSVELWKNVISDMLGPVVQSGHEAVTREEVIARNEVKDAIANTYLSNVVDSISEVYRILQMMISGNTAPVVVLGGFIEAQQRQKTLQTITSMYNMVKECGLNAQGFALEMLANCELPASVKQRLGRLMMEDPMMSPKVKQLQTQLQQAQQTIQNQMQQMTLLKIQASQRLERQAEFVASNERIKRGELQFKQWQQENKDTQEARMEILRKLLENGDASGALSVLDQIERTDDPVLAEPETQAIMNQQNDAVAENYLSDLNSIPIQQNGGIPNAPGNLGGGLGGVANAQGQPGQPRPNVEQYANDVARQQQQPQPVPTPDGAAGVGQPAVAGNQILRR